MNRRTFISVVFWSATVGGLVAILTGDNRAISLRIWLAAFAVWFGIAVLKQLFADTPLFPSRMLAVFARQRAVDSSAAKPLRELRALQGLLLRSRDNERAFAQQLQPRLAALTQHYLLLNHGIDRRADPERAARTLGGLGWLIDDTVHDRAPTLEELDTLVHLLISPTRPNAEEAA